MIAAQPSGTAYRVALRRAAHQRYDQPPLIFTDPYAIRILGPTAAEQIARTPDAERRPHSAAMRAWVVVRARLAEDVLSAAVQEHGVVQYLVLGAGLDTFALRNPYPQLRVFEVDFPATQAWKQHRLAAAELSLPANACFVPVDFETQSLERELQAAGFDPALPTVTAWLGVVPYLTPEAFHGTIALLGQLPGGSAVVFDYGQPREVLSPVEQLMHDSLAARVAQAGEPFRLFFTPDSLRLELEAFGLRVVEDLGSDELNARYFADRTDDFRLRSGSAGRQCHAVVA